MMIDKFENSALEIKVHDISDKLESLHGQFDSEIKAKEGVYIEASPESKFRLSKWIGVEESAIKDTMLGNIQTTMKQMYEGTELSNGEHSRGLREVGQMKISHDYEYQNIRQQSGFTAEIVSTAKENIKAAVEGSGIKTYRADDRPDLYPRNDQYVDKIREYPDGTIERIQVKFVGKDGAECLKKLASKDYSKYFEGDKIDRIEIPRDYYKEIRNDGLIEKEIGSLEKQLEHLKEAGKLEDAKKIESRIERYNKIDKMLEQSNTSSDEAVFARLHPEAYTRLQFAHQMGKESSLGAAGVTAAISTVENIKAVKNGKMTPIEAFGDTIKDTGKSGVVGYGAGFVSAAVAQAMTESSHNLIQSMGDAGIPGVVVSFGIASYDSVTDYAQGHINGRELAYDLGGNALGVTGTIVGSGLATAAVGSVVPGIGTAGGFAVGVVGGMVGYAVTTEAYKTALSVDGEGATALAEKAKEFATDTIEQIKTGAPERVDIVRANINSFAAEHSLPFQL